MTFLIPRATLLKVAPEGCLSAQKRMLSRTKTFPSGTKPAEIIVDFNHRNLVLFCTKFSLRIALIRVINLTRLKLRPWKINKSLILFKSILFMTDHRVFISSYPNYGYKVFPLNKFLRYLWHPSWSPHTAYVFYNELNF